LICFKESIFSQGIELSSDKTGRYVNEETKEFWNGEVVGKFVTIQFGVIGGITHTASREFSSYGEAKEFLEDRVARKIQSGYRKVD
jgi:predicted DNA-binding WGR domain protein